MKEIKTARLILRPFREADYDDLYEFLSQLKDENGDPVWKDTFVYAVLKEDLR